jgi:hypothetical protein
MLDTSIHDKMNMSRIFLKNVYANEKEGHRMA